MKTKDTDKLLAFAKRTGGLDAAHQTSAIGPDTVQNDLAPKVTRMEPIRFDRVNPPTGVVTPGTCQIK